jgi:AMIN domain
LLGYTAVAIAESQVSTIDHVPKTGAENSIVVAIDAGQPLIPKAQFLSEPDRIVVDFPMLCQPNNCATYYFVELCVP